MLILVRNISFLILILVCNVNIHAQAPLTNIMVFDFNIGDEFHFGTSSYGNFNAREDSDCMSLIKLCLQIMTH